jgi:hypothetical protein
VFQLILPFQLELPFDGPETARSAHKAARVRRSRVRLRARQGGALSELAPAMVAPAAEPSRAPAMVAPAAEPSWAPAMVAPAAEAE